MWYLVAPIGLAIVAGVYPFLRQAISAATGFTAMLVCAGVYQQGRTIADVFSHELSHEPVANFLRATIVPGGVTASFVGNLFPHTATWNIVNGCTLQSVEPPPAIALNPATNAIVTKKLLPSETQHSSKAAHLPRMVALLNSQLVPSPANTRARTRSMLVMRTSTDEVLAHDTRYT